MFFLRNTAAHAMQDHRAHESRRRCEHGNLIDLHRAILHIWFFDESTRKGPALFTSSAAESHDKNRRLA